MSLRTAAPGEQPGKVAVHLHEQPSANGQHEPDLHHLHELIEHAAHLLPAQGPITVFIHHNTLHAFEHLPFDEAVKRGAKVFGCHPYLTADRYRDKLAKGRIGFDNLRSVIREDLGTAADEPILNLCTRLELRLAMLQYPLHSGPTEELLWHVAEKDALRRIRSEASAAIRDRLIAETRRWVMRDLRGGHEADGRPEGRRRAQHSLAQLLERYDESAMEIWTNENWERFTLQAMWRLCCEGAASNPAPATPAPAHVRHRDLLLEATAVDADLLVNELLIRFCAAFLDQGFAAWQLPRRNEGFYASFCALYRQPGGPPAPWLHGLAKELARLDDANVSALASIRESLEQLGVLEKEWDSFISATLLALRGWGGMVKQVEVRGDRVVRSVPEHSLVEFLAVRLLLDRFALAYCAREEFGYTGPLRGLRDELREHLGKPQPPSTEQRAFLVFQLAQVLGWSPAVLQRLGERDWATLLHEIEIFSVLERGRIFHTAFERRFCTQTLDAVVVHCDNPAPTPRQPRFQACFCLDEREESLRRHIEELAPDAVTYGTAGFYAVAMYYRGVADAHFVPLCPAILTPKHWVAEEVVKSLEEDNVRRAKTRRALGMAARQFHIGSRSFVVGALLAAAGMVASVPLIARTLFPRLTARIRSRFGSFVQAPPLTRLRLLRSEPTPGPEGGCLGFSFEEMTNIGERVLRDIGLISGFSRLVLFFGHGSQSVNNPHASAYDCGACGGAPGGANARALAQILNDRRIRECLAQRGIIIPQETHFIGGMHNTSNETMTYHDLDLLPESHRDDFDAVRATLEKACNRNAHERCRRFVSAPLTISFEMARQHVEGRAEDLAQPRPELGHATNAICMVGRRSTTRGLFFDRRAFLVSYDPTQDDADCTILTRTLLPVFPVCSGISLEYYFSYMDNYGWGCGTKLPHNISALLGVMDGAASDLRTGLPWQMVEIHEPFRLLFVIETTTDKMMRIIECNEGIGRLVKNAWVHLAVLHPQTRELSCWRNGRFELYQPSAATLPSATSSVNWYRGWRDHLEFAEIVQ